MRKTYQRYKHIGYAESILSDSHGPKLPYAIVSSKIRSTAPPPKASSTLAPAATRTRPVLLLVPQRHPDPA